MNTVQPIRKTKDLQKLKEYYRVKEPNIRNELLIITGLHTALRISDILGIQWDMVYDFNQKKYRSHILLTEQKTGKVSTIYLNQQIKKVLKKYEAQQRKNGSSLKPETYLFCHPERNMPISRVQAYRIIKRAARESRLPGVVSCHSLRKTFGYHAWKQGVPPVMLMNIYNHSSYQITKRYLGIEQDDRDQIFQKIDL